MDGIAGWGGFSHMSRTSGFRSTLRGFHRWGSSFARDADGLEEIPELAQGIKGLSTHSIGKGIDQLLPFHPSSHAVNRRSVLCKIVDHGS